MRFLAVIFLVLLSSACTGVKQTDTETEAEPYVETSFEYKDEAKKPIRRTPAQMETEQSVLGNNQITVGALTYSVIETTSGFSVLGYDNSGRFITQASYVPEDPYILSISNPRIGTAVGSSFPVTMKVLRTNGNGDATFMVNTSPLMIMQASA